MTRSRHADYIKTVLLDTSVCVGLLRADGSDGAERARELLIARRAAICDPVVMELMQGCRMQRQFDAVDELAANCHELELEPEDWLVAGRARAADLEKGLTVSPFDYLIAAVAVRYGTTLLTADGDYERIGLSVELA